MEAAALILETTFLIDLERELLRGRPGPAQGFLEAHPDASLSITFTVAGELAAGVPPDRRERWERLVSPFEVLPSTPAVCWAYGQAARYLRTNGLLIGTNDLWIAATAVAFNRALVTRNVKEFQRVPGVRLMPYR